MKLNLSEEARQEFVKAGLKGGKRTLKNKGKKHFSDMGIASKKARDARKLAQLQAGDNSLDTTP